MTGAEHYREAERLAEEARLASDEPGNTIWTFGEAIQAAQVHATLALAAATALCQDGGHEPAIRQWLEAAS
jgi:hypothetical protein